MKTYELSQPEISLIVKALRYATEYGYENTQCQEEMDEYNDMKALIRRLDPQPYDKKQTAWMAVDGYKSYVTNDGQELNAFMDKHPNARITRITWEEHE